MLIIAALIGIPLWAIIGWRNDKSRGAFGTGPRCAHCQYPLRGLEQLDRCPECGQPYALRDGDPRTNAS